MNDFHPDHDWHADDTDRRTIDRAYLVIAALYACALIAGVAGMIELFG